MALSEERTHRGRPTFYPWERQALDQIYRDISDNDPHQAWELHELHDPSTGRLYEIDLAFLSRVGLFLVEIKSHPGVLTGDVVDWTFTESGGRRTIECPYAGVNHKARVLAGLLERQLPERPFVHAAVFVPNATNVQLEGGRPPWLLLARDVASRLVNGLDDQMPRRVVNRPMMKAILQAANKLGLRPSRASRMVGGFSLGALVDEGEGYQEHLARHPSVGSDRARIRSYLVPSATSASRRRQLERAAQREAKTLSQLGQHPRILGYRTFVPEAPLGPAVVFEAFEDGLPLHVFLKQEPDLAFDERLHLLQAVVEAVAHCHRADVLHRNLSPGSVLVRREGGKLAVRVHRFQTSTSREHGSAGTRHLDELAHALDRIYQAPEVLSDPQKATVESDMFSVGCLAWLLLTGQHPAATLAERELRLRESEDGGLRPSSVRADLAALDEAVAFATRPNLHDRPDNVTAWFELWMIEAITRPSAEPDPMPDPYEAQKGDTLPGGLRIERRLGSGGTAVVFHVRREGRDLALKVPHDEGCGARLLAEAQVLRELRHEHIMALHEVVTLGQRACLLLEFSGDRSLADVLREQGTLPLDLARRFGDDLLSAVQYLEECGVTHRDIKPSNLGFTSHAKRQQHLLLLDFSLSSVDPTAVEAGTAEWRDPWLYLRGRWDSASDRWSAAAVLYQSLTGVRPARAEGPGTSEEVVVEAERFDAAVRDRLAAFFRRALGREVSTRFESAEAMRLAWQQALIAGESQREEEAAPASLDLSQVRADTPVDALPLSARARNALDRAGVPLVADLLLLPRNQLSVVRGIGTKVAKEIVAIAEALRTHLEVTAPPPLVPGFLRPRLALDDADVALEARLLDELLTAGLTNTVDVALAPRRRIELLVGAKATTALAERLLALSAPEPAPGSLGDWVRALLGRASETEASRRVRVLVGLDAFPDGRLDTGHPATRSVPEVAEAFGLEPAQVHSSLQFLRGKRWADSEVRTVLVDTLRALLASSPATPLDDLARALSERRCPEVPTPDDLRFAAALIRVALELRPEPVAQWRRLAMGAWIARDPKVLDALPALGTAADMLASIEPLPSSETVRQALAQASTDTPLATLPHDQRVALAARASHTAAASARLELYPRGMDAGRALLLSLSVLTGAGLTPEVVRKRVAARYPEARPLPDRSQLDPMLVPHGLVFVPDVGEYLRSGQPSLTSMTVQAPSRAPTAQPGHPRRRSPDAQRAMAFEDQLRRGVASKRFRVIQVRADLATRSVVELAEALGVAPVSLDHALVEALRATAAELEVDWSNVEAADRAGPEGPDWPLLVELVKRAIDALVDRLLSPADGPLLLAWPGTFARYGLSGALARLVERAERGDTHAVILVVPSHADGLAPSINGRLPVPAPLPGQRLILPDAWLRNAHGEAELV
jgi:serine/threonine protein kinase